MGVCCTFFFFLNHELIIFLRTEILRFLRTFLSVFADIYSGAELQNTSGNLNIGKVVRLYLQPPFQQNIPPSPMSDVARSREPLF